MYLNKLWKDFDEILQKGEELSKDQTLGFCWQIQQILDDIFAKMGRPKQQLLLDPLYWPGGSVVFDGVWDCWLPVVFAYYTVHLHPCDGN